MRLACAVAITVASAGACGGSSGPTPEPVVDDASLGGSSPQVIGASSGAVFWTASSATTVIGAAPLTSLPSQGAQIASASGPIAHAGDEIVFADGTRISRVDATGAIAGVTNAQAEAVGGNETVSAWTTAGTVSWLRNDIQSSAMLTKIDACDHVRVTPSQIYVAADGTTGRRLVRIDQRTATVTPITSATIWSTMFPGGPMAGATYTGRIVDATDDNVLWLVEELPSHRAILISNPAVGDPSVILEHVMGASGFFASATDLYWQEGDALLTAPRAGGAASIVTSLPGPAGALADGYIYFTDGSAIERLRVE